MEYALYIGFRLTAGSPDLEIVHRAMVVTHLDGKRYLLVVYNRPLDPDYKQTESMLLLYYVCSNSVIIDGMLLYYWHRDGSVGTYVYIEDLKLLFYYDNKIIYWTTEKPTPNNLDLLPIIELTSLDMPKHYSKVNCINLACRGIQNKTVPLSIES